MAVINNEIKRYRGDTYPIIATLKENSIPVDLTNSTVKLTIGYNIPVTIIGNITDATNGVVQFEFGAAEVAVVGRFKYDIQAETGSYVTTYVKDNFILTDDITK